MSFEGPKTVLKIFLLIKTYDNLEHTVAQMNQQTIVIALFSVLLLTDNIISLGRSVLNKHMWHYSYMNKNRTHINVALLFMTEVLDSQYYFNVILFHALCCSLPRELNK